jgi:mono/diheme cytochrome c family protein
MGKNIVRMAVTTVLVAISAFALAEDSKERAIAAGKTNFMNNCAACHGDDGRGAGAMAGELDKSPTNLTLLSKTNGGAFPFEEIYDTIDGREQVGAHGPRDMPVWGSEYKMGVPTVSGSSEAVVRGKILELILYIESIQE